MPDWLNETKIILHLAQCYIQHAGCIKNTGIYLVEENTYKQCNNNCVYAEKSKMVPSVTYESTLNIQNFPRKQFNIIYYYKILHKIFCELSFHAIWLLLTL